MGRFLFPFPNLASYTFLIASAMNMNSSSVNVSVLALLQQRPLIHLAN
jgi:hypothetical protein